MDPASTDASCHAKGMKWLRKLHVNVHHTIRECFVRTKWKMLRDSVIESQTLRLTPCRNVTSQKETVSHTVGTDELPLCKDTEDITMSPAVTDVTYSIVTGDTKTVRVDSLNGISAAEIHSSIPMVTVISFMLQL
uniref:Uncharacterized protein n=1 Tax=Magallana gigas TaxID=29159 RepID=A0A8W8JQ15_MAGGI